MPPLREGWHKITVNNSALVWMVNQDVTDQNHVTSRQPLNRKTPPVIKPNSPESIAEANGIVDRYTLWPADLAPWVLANLKAELANAIATALKASNEASSILSATLLKVQNDLLAEREARERAEKAAKDERDWHIQALGRAEQAESALAECQKHKTKTG